MASRTQRNSFQYTSISDLEIGRGHSSSTPERGLIRVESVSYSETPRWQPGRRTQPTRHTRHWNSAAARVRFYATCSTSVASPRPRHGSQAAPHARATARTLSPAASRRRISASRPSPSSSNATTRAGASRSWRIARCSKRARNTSYAMPRSANGCPRNRVRYSRETSVADGHRRRAAAFSWLAG